MYNTYARTHQMREHRCQDSTYKVRNETKPTKAKRNQLKQNEIDRYEENGRKKNKRQNEIKK